MNSKIAFVSAMLAIAATSAPSPPAHAAPKRSPQAQCEAEGYLWSAALGCGNQWCSTGPGAGNAEPPGNQIQCYKVGKPQGPYWCICNGFTGDWDTFIAGSPSRQQPYPGMILTPPAGPAVLTPPMHAPPLQVAPPAPATPLPLGGAQGR